MLSEDSVRKIVRQIGLGLLGVAAVTEVCFPLHLDFAIAGFLYLLAVVLLSPAGGFASSVIISLTAVLCLDFFFTPPILRLEVASPIDAVALVTYLATSLIITRLASQARQKALSEERKQKAVAKLYETALRLFSMKPEAASIRGTLQIFHEVLEVEAVCLYDASIDVADAAGAPNPHLEQSIRQAAKTECDSDDGPAGATIRRLHVGGQRIGAIGFVGLADAESLAAPLATLAGASLERARAFQTASAAAAISQAEILRTAIVDAFAHQFKTPLAAVLAAAGGISEAGGLTPAQLELLEIIESEGIRLSRMSTRLLATARLDHAEVQPRLEPTDLSELVLSIVDQARTGAHAIRLQWDGAPIVVASDRELLALAVTQLLDNALKYAPRHSPIEIQLTAREGEALVRVTNYGNSIAPAERERIFERFYRGASAHSDAGGAGLGLYVARKIAAAHLGTLELEDHGGDSERTTFCMRLPARAMAPQHACKTA